MSILKACDLTTSALLHLLEELTPPTGEPVYCWLEAPDGWALDHWRREGGNVRWNAAGHLLREEVLKAVLPRVTSGRVFASSGELKWRFLPALGERRCRVVFLGDGWTAPSLDVMPSRGELVGLSRDEAEYPLWGQQSKNTPGEWIDLRIPHRLRYPVAAETPQRGRVIVRVRVEIWKDRRGEPQFIRLCDLQAQWEE